MEEAVKSDKPSICFYCGCDTSEFTGSLRITHLEGSVFKDGTWKQFHMGESSFCDSMCLDGQVEELIAGL